MQPINNWIKTGVIPSPKNEVYTKDDFSALIKYTEGNSTRLQSRANHSHQNSSDVILDKKRKEPLLNLIETFKKSTLSVQEATACPGRQILSNNNLFDEKSEVFVKIMQIYDGTNIFKSFNIENKMMIF